MRKYQTACCTGLLAWGALVLGGCDTRETRVYDAPKSKIPAETKSGSVDSGTDSIATPPATPAGFRNAKVENLTFDVPDAWKEDPSPRQMRLATFAVNANGQSGELIFSKFPGLQGSLATNVSRWRGQVGLAPVTEVNEAAISKVTLSGKEAMLFDFSGPDPASPAKRVIQVVATRGDGVYYIKLLGSAELVASQKEAFQSLLASLRFSR